MQRSPIQPQTSRQMLTTARPQGSVTDSISVVPYGIRQLAGLRNYGRPME